MRYPTITALLLALAPIAATAQTVERRVEPNGIAMQVARDCAVQPTFVAVERGTDGILRYQVAPTLTDAQSICVVTALRALGVAQRKQ